MEARIKKVSCIILGCLLAGAVVADNAVQKKTELEKLGYSETKVVVPADVSVGEVNDREKPKLKHVPEYFKQQEKNPKLRVKVEPTHYCNKTTGDCAPNTWTGGEVVHPNQVSNINRNMGQPVNNSDNSNVSVDMHLNSQ